MRLGPGMFLAREVEALPELSPNNSSLSRTLGPPPKRPFRKPCLGGSGNSIFS